MAKSLPMHISRDRPRSAYDELFPSTSDPASPPTNASMAAEMDSVGEVVPTYYVNSVLAEASPNADGRAHGHYDHQPLAIDFATMQDKHGIKGLYSPSASPISQTAGDWPSDEDTAPAPPNVSRRDIHIPLRTSSSNATKSKRRSFFSLRRSSDMSTYLPDTPDSLKSFARGSPRAPSTEGKRSNRAPSPGPGAGQTPTPMRSSSRTPSSNQAPVRSSSRGLSPGPAPAPMHASSERLRSSADSVISTQSSVPSIATAALPALQHRVIDDGDRLSPLLEDDPKSWDLVAPEQNHQQYSLETRSEQLFSREHLRAIFADTPSLLRFTSFLSVARPNSVPTLIYYLDAQKALRAINYANAVAEALEPISGLEFTETPARPTMNAILEEKASQAFDILVRDDLPAFITHIFIQTASVSIAKRVTGNLPPMLREASEGLAEVFCLTDPSRTDNPIIFASEEFHRTTQYGVSYAIGRNCRFLQGPQTNRNSVARFKEMCVAGKEHSEVFLNYRRDGSPFMNLLMIAPLLDSRGTLRYFIGAQIDVSGLVKDCTDLDAFQRMLDEKEGIAQKEEPKDEFQELSEMFNNVELDTVRKYGGNMHRDHVDEQDDKASIMGRPRLLIKDQSTVDIEDAERPLPKPDGRLSGPYKHYLLVRPAPSLRILFTSPTLRVPGILQSPFLERIGGSNRIRESVRQALSDGSRGVTAKIRWLPHAVQDLDDAVDEGRPRWIHCTPLLGQGGSVGIWMIVLVDDDKHGMAGRRFRQAPPVANDVRSQRYPGGDIKQMRSGRMDGYDDRGLQNGYSANVSASQHGYNGGGGGGGGAYDYHMAGSPRPPASPRQANSPRNMGEQRVLRSAGSSLIDYRNGYAASSDSFNI